MQYQSKELVFTNSFGQLSEMKEISGTQLDKGWKNEYKYIRLVDTNCYPDYMIPLVAERKLQ